MHFFKKILLLGLIFGSVAAAAQEQDSTRFDEELNERDFDALRDYLKRKRSVQISDNDVSNLTISGDVRSEWRHLNETCCGRAVRGGGNRASKNDFDIEFNLRFDYICERTWAVAHVRYDNSAGVDDNDHPCSDGINGCEEIKALCKKSKRNCITCREQADLCRADPEGFHGSGRCNDLCLKKAYFGYNFCKTDADRFYMELGRRGQLYNVFDSNIEFLSRLDGIFLKYERTNNTFGNWYIQGAGFVVDEKRNHFAWAMETGWLNVADQNFDLKYSFIDWEKHGDNRCHVHNPRGFRFLNSQWLIAYHLDCSYLTVPAKLYAAFLCNHAAKKLHFERCRSKLANLGWYAGILIGKVVKEGDWAVEVQYQVVQAQAVPDDDCAGICRGNVLDESFTSCSLRGNTNFEGWRVEGLYAITDNLTLDTIYEKSRAYDANIGGRHKYSKFELEAIYAF